MPRDEGWHELATRSGATVIEEEEGQPTTHREDIMNEEDTWSETDETSLGFDGDSNDEQLNRRTIRKLDYVLLPFLCSLFLLNSIDKSNIGNAETAGTCPSKRQHHHPTQRKPTLTNIHRLHPRHRPLPKRPQHLPRLLLRLLRRPAARRRRSRPQVWHDSLGPGLHDSMGLLYAAAHLGAQALAADLTASSNRNA